MQRLCPSTPVREHYIKVVLTGVLVPKTTEELIAEMKTRSDAANSAKEIERLASEKAQAAAVAAKANNEREWERIKVLVDNEIISLNEALSATGVKLSMREQRNTGMSNAIPIFRISVGGNQDAFKHQYVAVLNRTHDGKLHVIYQNDRNPGSNPRITFELVATNDAEVGLIFNRLLELINED